MEDPTFAAIEAHQQADHLLEQASGAAADAAREAEIESASGLLRTVPTTMAGLAALLEYICTAPGMYERVIADTTYGDLFFKALKRMAVELSN